METKDAAMLADLEWTETGSYPPHGLAPVSPEVIAAHDDDIPYSLDLTTDHDAPGQADDIDKAAIAAVIADQDSGPQPAALWRVWRIPAQRTSGPPPRRLYLIHAPAADGRQMAGLAARVRETLAAAGESDPRVEVFDEAGGLPMYHRTALGFAALLWAGEPAEPVHIAALYDHYDPEAGPGFAEDHPEIPDEEHRRLLEYLDGGAPLTISPALAADVLDPERAEVIPIAFRTDGRWIWSDASIHYLMEYDLAPDPRLLEHIRGMDYQRPEVSLVALHRALSTLYGSTENAIGEDSPRTEPLAPVEETTEAGELSDAIFSALSTAG